jgi:hypothetical protein
MKKFFNLMLMAGLATGTMLTSCTSDDPAPSTPTEALSGILAEDQTLTPDKIWFLDGRVIVPDGITLTIAPGTIIKGNQGQGTLASALIIARGGTILAQGTPDNPIIMTSEVDNIGLGEKEGSNLTKEDNELWGGLIVLGSAPISAENGDTETTIEGLPANEEYAKYGGSNVMDNSGVISYVSVRHGGISIGEGNEINGITFGGVGAGTAVNNVEVYATLDDGIECFGGSVNITNALVFYQGDDGVDLDMNYSGIFNNFLVVHGDGIGTDEGLEIDGPEGSTYTDGLFSLVDGTCRSQGSTDGSPGDFKSKAQGAVANVKFTYPNGKKLKIRASYTNNCVDPKTDAFTHLTDAIPNLVFNSQEVPDGIEVYTGSEDDNGGECSVPQADQDAAEALILNSTQTGADESVFSWTLAATRGEL